MLQRMRELFRRVLNICVKYFRENITMKAFIIRKKYIY